MPMGVCEDKPGTHTFSFGKFSKHANALQRFKNAKKGISGGKIHVLNDFLSPQNTVASILSFFFFGRGRGVI